MGSGATLGAAPRAAAQGRPRAELRADALVGRDASAQAGVGVELDAGLYARVAVVAAAGAAWRDGDGASARPAGRGELVARFLVDPARQSRRGAYLGGGVGVRVDGTRDDDPAARAYLLAVVGVEGRRRGAWAPSLEAGVGGGARLGVVLRRARADRR